MQGAQKLRSEVHLRVRRNDEVEAQSRSERDRWTFYETIIIPQRDAEERGIWLEKRKRPARAREGLLPCFGLEEEPDPDSPDRRYAVN